MSGTSNAQRILAALDSRLNAIVELTLYGRAALHLGFPNPPEEFALSLDVGAVFWLGQAQELADRSNFWDAVERTNLELAEQGLYASHFFEETQVILRPSWRQARIRIPGNWKRLHIWRLSDPDLLLSKLMRDDPQDQRDAFFIVEAGHLTNESIREALAQARVPDIAEIREQFERCGKKLLGRLGKQAQ